MSFPDLLLLRPAVLDAPPPPKSYTSARRSYVLRGFLLGALAGALARLWFRTISDDQVFSVGGTLFIILAFGGFGAASGLAYAWRRLGSNRRLLVQRGVGLVPFLFMGPAMPIFGPGFLAAWLAGRHGPGRWRRRALIAVAGLVTAFWLLVLLGRGPVGILSVALFVALAGALFWTNRVVFEARRAGPLPGPYANDPYQPWLAV